ncbi:unnamed protein product [Medioppia subpectinata]|uniref:Choline kinase n=1 Tax=Medioppia subpectinata TaxID=1979941 RepID=A0A7R9PT41_9ACAR|nr:unnamed protein product [Medioppia subpectinata]CAG2100035.1 unnamed protein product [Medioppia subpectinata]
MYRGETPEDIKERCLELCKEYLSDNWRQQTVDTISVRRITGGRSNQLYYCGITSPSIESTAPQEVAIRLYGNKWWNNMNRDGSGRVTDMKSERLNDVIISLMVSEKNLGPKLYGLFDGGQIQHFYHVGKFTMKEQNNPKLVKELFRKLAQIHALEVPLPKSEIIIKEIDLHYKEASERFSFEELFDKYNCETFKANDLSVEIQWLKNMITKTKSPIVFSHNDFWSSNIMVLNEESDSGDQLVICDYEYASYANRGMDLGHVIGEWGREGNDIMSDETFAADSVVKQLLQLYINENEIIYGESWSQNENNSMDQLLREAKNFGENKNHFKSMAENEVNIDLLVRGETPEDINERCLELCKEYLADNWRQQTVDTISVRRITGGRSNQLYYCGITSPSIESTVAQEVVIRLYGKKWWNNMNRDGSKRITDMNSERLSDVIISLMVSEKNLGPKIYGLFDSGQIQQFYHVDKFILTEQTNPKLVKELFRKLAQIHALEVPLPKSEIIVKEIELHYKEASERFSFEELFDKYNCETFKANDLWSEIQWLKNIIIKTKSPIVYSHNDFKCYNIMLLNKETDSGDQLVICDYEYSSYGNRGMDLGTIIEEWGRESGHITHDQTFTPDSVAKQLLQHYICENEMIYGKNWSQNENNSIDQLMREAKIYLI